MRRLITACLTALLVGAILIATGAREWLGAIFGELLAADYFIPALVAISSVAGIAAAIAWPLYEQLALKGTAGFVYFFTKNETLRSRIDKYSRYDWELQHVIEHMQAHLRNPSEDNWVRLVGPVQQALTDGDITARGKRMRQGESLGNKYTTPFSDIPQDHWIEHGLRWGQLSENGMKVVAVHTGHRDKVDPDQWIYRDVRFNGAQIHGKWPIKK